MKPKHIKARISEATQLLRPMGKMKKKTRGWPRFTDGNTKPQTRGFSLPSIPGQAVPRMLSRNSAATQPPPLPAPPTPLPAGKRLDFIMGNRETLARSGDNCF